MSTVPLASSWARQLVEAEQRRAGTGVKGAIQAVARRLRHPPGTVWGLLYRLPKAVSGDMLNALQDAVEAKLLRDIGELENELAAVRAGARRHSPGMVEEAERSLARLRAALREDA